MNENEKIIKEIENFSRLDEEFLHSLIGRNIKYTNDNDNIIESGCILSYWKENNYVILYLSNGAEIKLI